MLEHLNVLDWCRSDDVMIWYGSVPIVCVCIQCAWLMSDYDLRLYALDGLSLGGSGATSGTFATVVGGQQVPSTPRRADRGSRHCALLRASSATGEGAVPRAGSGADFEPSPLPPTGAVERILLLLLLLLITIIKASRPSPAGGVSRGRPRQGDKAATRPAPRSWSLRRPG